MPVRLLDKENQIKLTLEEEKLWRKYYHKNWTALNREKVREHSRNSHYKRFPTIREEKNRKRREVSKNRTLDKIIRDKRTTKNAQLRKKFGISLGEYEQMLVERNYVCDICGNPEKCENKTLAIDHEHSTGRIRGLLCQNCNVSLGHFKDSPVLLRAAATYLEKERRIQ